MCHKTCLTCTSSIFTGCLTCQPGLTLSAGTCSCSWWDTTCTVESNLREVFLFLNFFVLAYLVGIMLLYVLRIQLPISYRIWNGLNAISLLVYSEVIYFDFEDEYMLKSLAVSNGPFFSSSRVMNIGPSHLYPTVTIFGSILVAIFLLYLPYQIFYQSHESFLEYLKDTSLIFLDSFYFFSAKMMCFYIGKTINESGGESALSLAMSIVYGVIIFVFLVKFIYFYHQQKTQQNIYPSPLYLYTLLSPLTFIGLPLVTSSGLVLLIYCIPFGLLILIVILNKDFKIVTTSNVLFYVTEIIMIGLTITFILVDSTAQSYVLLGFVFACLLVITIEVMIKYLGGIKVKSGQIHPEEEEKKEEGKKDESEKEQKKKRNIGRSSKYI